MSVVTKTGDEGTTWAGVRLPKDSDPVEFLGDLDELNSWIGLLAVHPMIPSILYRDWDHIQDAIMRASAGYCQRRDWKDSHDEAQWLEDRVKAMEAELPELRNFILPRFPAEVHVARAVCRRVERRAAGLHRLNGMPPGIMIWLNRLSDYLFTLARWVCDRLNRPERIWAT